MSTTSNSRADLRSAAAAVLLLAACATTQPAADPEAPRPALAAPATKPPRAVANRPDSDAPIEVVSATVRPAAEVPEVLARLRRSGEDTSRLAVIDVTTSVDIMDHRSAYPVIVLNGRQLIDTLTLGPRRLAALVERGALRGQSSVTVTMIGDPTRTSRRAVTLRAP